MSSTGAPQTGGGHSPANPAKKRIAYLAIAALALLHHDFWFWDDTTLVFGFVPVGLAYHALYSVVAGLLWYVVFSWAWPSEVAALAHGEQKEKVKPE